MQKTFANICLPVRPFKLYDNLLSKIMCKKLCAVNSTRFDPPQGPYLKSPTYLCPIHCKLYQTINFILIAAWWLWTLT